MERELELITETAPNDKKEAFREEMASFSHLFGRFLQEVGPSVDWNRIDKLPEGAVKDYSLLQTPSDKEQIRAMLNKLVVVKLNGGLGTSMGCHGPKSVIPVRNDLTFLDLTVQQIEVSENYFIGKIIFGSVRKLCQKLIFDIFKKNS
jgi:UTP--glucose-1-phosphate uridylyltransferase